MFILSKKVIEKIENDRDLRFKIAGTMGNGEAAVKADIKLRKGKTIAVHHDALNVIIDYMGLTTHDVRVAISEKQST